MGDASDNVIDGLGGDDIIYGDSNVNPVGSGNDTLLGGAGNDEIHGGDGNDVLQGEDDEDTVNVDDTGDQNDNLGELTSTRIDGLDMAGYIEYAPTVHIP